MSTSLCLFKSIVITFVLTGREKMDYPRNKACFRSRSFIKEHFVSTNGNVQRWALTAEVIFGTGGPSNRGDKAGKWRPLKGTYLFCMTLLYGNSVVVVVLNY